MWVQNLCQAFGSSLLPAFRAGPWKILVSSRFSCTKSRYVTIVVEPPVHHGKYHRFIV